VGTFPRRAGVARHGDVIAPITGNAGAAKSIDDGCELLRSKCVVGDREDAVTACRALDDPSMACGAGHPERNGERLGGPCRDVDSVVLAGVRMRSPGPHGAHYGKCFVEHRRSYADVVLLSE